MLPKAGCGGCWLGASGTGLGSQTSGTGIVFIRLLGSAGIFFAKTFEGGKGSIELAVVAGFEKARPFEIGGVFFHAGFLHSPQAHLTPLGDDHFLDEHGFDGRDRLQFLSERAMELIEAGARFAVENDGAGEHASAPVGVGGIAFSLRGDRPAGLGSIETGCFDLFFGSHTTGLSYRRVCGWVGL